MLVSAPLQPYAYKLALSGLPVREVSPESNTFHQNNKHQIFCPGQGWGDLCAEGPLRSWADLSQQFTVTAAKDLSYHEFLELTVCLEVA